MAKKNLSEDEIKYIVSAETSKAQKEIHELSKANKELASENRKRLDKMIELEAQSKKNTQEYQQLRKEYDAERKQINQNNKLIAERTRQLDVNAMSMVQLRKQAKDLKRELDNTAQALEPERYAELEVELAKVNGRMTELKTRVGEVKQEAQGFSFKDWFLGTAVSRVLVDSLQQMTTWFRNVAAEGVEMAQAADGVTRAFRQLDDGHILDNLRKATKGTVTDLDLMKAAVQAKDFRIPLEDLGKYLQFAQLKAQQTGQSVEYMTNSIVTGLGRKSVMILDNLGISASEVNEQIKQGAGFTQAVANIVDKQLAAAGESYVSAADRASAAAVNFRNKQLELGQALLPVKERFEEVFNFGVSRLMDLATWIAKNLDVIGPLTTAIGAYVLAMKAAA
ncbi:MAG: 2-oxoacid:ferredoxin oxidoreductase subunit delta, partial [Bacteroidales bacterium]|nr:2-oxoacid:ferredoxin oxidoreductase subunit delta [Bacteroidales bacterium]